MIDHLNLSSNVHFYYYYYYYYYCYTAVKLFTQRNIHFTDSDVQAPT